MLDRLFGLDEDFVYGGYYWHGEVLKGFDVEVVGRVAHVLGVDVDVLKAKLGGDGSSYPSSAGLYRLAVALNRVHSVKQDDEGVRSWVRGSLEVGGKWVGVVDLMLSSPGGRYVLGEVDELLKEKWKAGPAVEVDDHGDLLGSGGELEGSVVVSEEEGVWDKLEDVEVEGEVDVEGEVEGDGDAG